jgi:hypothetical protein
VIGEDANFVVDELVTIEKYDDATGELLETIIIHNGVIENIIKNEE